MAEPLQNKLVLRLGHVRASTAATLGLRTSLFSKTKGFARHYLNLKRRDASAVLLRSPAIAGVFKMSLEC